MITDTERLDKLNIIVNSLASWQSLAIVRDEYDPPFYCIGIYEADSIDRLTQPQPSIREAIDAVKLPIDPDAAWKLNAKQTLDKDG